MSPSRKWRVILEWIVRSWAETDAAGELVAQPSTVRPKTDLEEEVRRLRRDNEILREEREIQKPPGPPEAPIPGRNHTDRPVSSGRREHSQPRLLGERAQHSSQIPAPTAPRPPSGAPPPFGRAPPAPGGQPLQDFRLRKVPRWPAATGSWVEDVSASADPAGVADPAASRRGAGVHAACLDGLSCGCWLAGGWVRERVLYDIPVGSGGEDRGLDAVCWSPDGSRLAVGGEDGVVRVMRPDGRPLWEGRHEARVWSVSWSPDGRWLASGSDDRTVRAPQRPRDDQPTMGAERPRAEAQQTEPTGISPGDP